MDEQNNQLRELLGSVMPPTVQTPDAWTEKHGVITESIQGVLNNYCIALTKGDLIANAKSWKDHTSEYSPHFIGLLLMILSCEWTKLGSLSINVSSENESPLYNRVLMAIARKLLGWAKAEDYALIDQHIVGSRYVNMKHQRDIRDMKEYCQEHDKKNKKGKKKKKDDEESEEEEEAPPDLSHSNIDIIPVAIPPILDQFNFILLCERDPRVGAVSVRRGELMDTLNEDQLIADNHSLFRHFAPAIVIPPESIPQPGVGTLIVPKCTMTFTAVKDANGATIGYLVQFLQHDPSWNPGKMIEILSTQIDQRSKNRTNQRYVDPWPQYIPLLGTDFPVHSLTYARWLHTVNSITGAKADMGYEGSIEQYGKSKGIGDYSNPLHPCNVFTMRRALMRLSQAGGVVLREDEYFDSRNKVALFPHDVSYRFLPEQVFWDDTDKVGFRGKYFPGNNQLVNSPLSDMLEERAVVLRSDVMKHTTRVEGYRTNNILIYYQREADLLYERVQMGDLTLQEANQMGMDKLASVCQLEGSVDSLSLSPGLKATLIYLQGYIARNPHITRELPLEDPSLSVFGNSVIRDLRQYETCFKIIHTLISFHCHGLLSVAQRRMAQILFSFLIFSEFGYGKSFTGPGFVRRTFIPGTWVRTDRATDAADQTDQGTHDEIRTYDEADETIVSEEYAKRHPEKANMKKTAVVEGEVWTKTFEKRTIQGVGDFRANRIVRTAQNYTEIGCTNTAKINKNAVGSRYHQKILKGSDIPATELNYAVDPEKKRAALEDFRLYQAVSYWCEKGMAIYAICREPNMELWYDVSNRMFEFLRFHNVIDIQRQARILEIMTPMARQMVVKYAYHCTFNLPSGAGYHKVFHPSLFAHMQEYLYCTLDIILFVWTLLSNEVINEDMEDVLEAAYRLVSGKSNISTCSTYELYQQNPLLLKTDKNRNHNRDVDGKLNLNVVDLNYLQITSDVKTVASQLSPLTKSKISATDVESCLKNLSEQHYTPSLGPQGLRNGYHPVPCDDLAAHRIGAMPKHILRADKHMEAIMAFVIEIKDTLVYDVVSKIQGISPITLSSYHACKGYIAETIRISDMDLVFLYWMRAEWTIWRNDLIQLKSRTIQEIPRDAMERIVRSFLNLESNPDPYMQAIQLNLTYQQCQLILFGFERGFIMESSSPVLHFERRNIVRDPADIRFPHYISDADIPQIYGIPMGEPSSHSIRIVELSKGRVCFSPAAAKLFDRNMILEAFIWATFCESTPPGKRVLGWEHPEDISKASVVVWDQNFINGKIRKFNQENPHGVNRLNGVVFKRRGDYGIETIYDLDHWSAKKQHEICQIRDPIIRDPAWIHKHNRFGTLDYPKTYLEQQKKVENTLWRVNSMNQ